MQYSLALLSASLCLAAAKASLSECDNEIERTGSQKPAACAHFDATDTEGYRLWFDENDIAEKYPSMVYLQGSDPNHPENGAAVHWDTDSSYLYLAVAARATGWVGFGIAEAGGMLGADMALFTAENPTEVVDAYTKDKRMPLVDDCSSDWEFISSNIDDQRGFIMFETKRLLDTGDNQDRRIVEDCSPLIPPHRVIAAWGDTTELSGHGLNRARGAIRFFGTGDDGTTFKNTMHEQSEGSFTISSVNHEIARRVTEYAHTCFSHEDMLELGVLDTNDMLNVIGFDPIIQEGNEAYVHHFVIRGSEQNDCSGNTFSEVVFVWAPGEGPLVLPSHLGAPIFGANGYQAFEIEVHYNNPQRTTGIIDSSGVRVYWTSQPREYQIGVLSLGDPNVGLNGRPVGNGNTVHTFECPSTCSGFVNATVHVLREYLHAHETGARLVNEQIRGGEVIRTGSLDYWEFNQNGNAAVQQNPFDIVPGDGFRTTCYFRGNDRRFGLASSQEMCMAFLYYYPRLHLAFPTHNLAGPWYCSFDFGFHRCRASYKASVISNDERFGRMFGYVAPNGKCLPDSTQAPNDDFGGETDNDGSSTRIGSGNILGMLTASVIVALNLATIGSSSDHKERGGRTVQDRQ